jgi:CubicO group peptidase (beta-lactamase class C family)
MGILLSEGLFKYEDLVTDHWPEFGKNGKGHIKMVDIMRHEAGLYCFSSKMDLDKCSTEGIQNNYVGEMIENESCIWL